MNKLLLILGLSLGLATSALSNSFNGKFVCEIVYVSDGSREKIVMVIDGNSMKSKRLSLSDAWYSEEELIYRGQYNSFVTFARRDNTILEDITVISKVSNGRYHYNRISAEEYRKFSGLKKAQARHKVGICDKF